MNISEYISSGVLESYVMGALSDQEREEVERNLSLYPELRAELALIEQTQEQLLQAAAISPPEQIRENILTNVTTAENARPFTTRSFPWKLATAASVSIALIASILAYGYYQNWRNAESSLLALNQQNQRIASDYTQVTERLDDMEQDLRVMTNPNFKRVLMTGSTNAPEALAAVYWNEKTREVFVHVHEMKELAQEKQYQLWAFIDGKPVDAGVFDANTAGLIPMKKIGKGPVTFAVTVEDRGGKPSPTVETIQMTGNVPNS
jgi:anti-sigma-K factor RskA